MKKMMKLDAAKVSRMYIYKESKESPKAGAWSFRKIQASVPVKTRCVGM